MLRSLLWSGALALILALTLNVGLTMAHGGAELTVSPAAAAPGDTITVEGQGLEAGEVFTITLEGMSFQTELGRATVGEDEDFHQQFALPREIPPGTYQVLAVSEEGERLSAELTIVGSTGGQPAAAPEPSAEPMDLDRTISAGQWVVIIAGVVASVGAGVILLRGRKESQS